MPASGHSLAAAEIPEPSHAAGGMLRTSKRGARAEPGRGYAPGRRDRGMEAAKGRMPGPGGRERAHAPGQLTHIPLAEAAGPARGSFFAAGAREAGKAPERGRPVCWPQARRMPRARVLGSPPPLFAADAVLRGV
jgi:hypothetical protein